MESTPNPQTTPEEACPGANTPNPEEPEEPRRELGDTDQIADQDKLPATEVGGTAGETIPAQIQHAEEFALNQGYEIVDIHADVSPVTDRPALTKLLEEAAQPDGPFTTILTVDPNKLSDSTPQPRETKDFLEE